MILRKGHKRWFKVNCSMMLYQWDGKKWVFTGEATGRYINLSRKYP